MLCRGGYQPPDWMQFHILRAADSCAAVGEERALRMRRALYGCRPYGCRRYFVRRARPLGVPLSKSVRAAHTLPVHCSPFTIHCSQLFPKGGQGSVAVPEICAPHERRLQISTAATPFCSLYPPLAALANVPSAPTNANGKCGGRLIAAPTGTNGGAAEKTSAPTGSQIFCFGRRPERRSGCFFRFPRGP